MKQQQIQQQQQNVQQEIIQQQYSVGNIEQVGQAGQQNLPRLERMLANATGKFTN